MSRNFFQKSTREFFTSLESELTATLPEGVSLEELVTEPGALAAAISAEAQGETPDISAAQIEEIQAAFLSDAQIELGEGTAADSLAALVGSEASATAQLDSLTTALASAGITLPEAKDGAYDATELKAAIETTVTATAATIAAGAGVPAADVPDVEPEGDFKTDAEINAAYQAMEPGSDARLDYFKANKAAILRAQN